MTFIDWSDTEQMFDLLIEFIRDEMKASEVDSNRHQFLKDLIPDVSSARELDVSSAINKLNAIQDSIDDEFKSDPVILHIADFVEELERFN